MTLLSEQHTKRVSSLRFLGVATGSGPIATAGIGFGLATLALCVGMLVATQHERTAILVAAATVGLLLTTNLPLLGVLLAISLPFPVSIVGGAAGLNVAASDVLLMVAFATVLVAACTGRIPGLALTLRPALLALAPYTAWVAIGLGAHFSLSGVFQTVQRLELFLVPVVVGGALAMTWSAGRVLTMYLISSTVFAALWPFLTDGGDAMGVQKNPGGQFIANALILLIAVPALRRRGMLLTLPVLCTGLLWTQSRGAVLSVLAALVVLLVFQPGKARARFALMMVPLAIGGLVAWSLLPDEARERNTDFSTASNSGTAAARSLEYRREYARQAWQMIHADPVFGVGVGNYVTGGGIVRPTSSDPHRSLLLDAAEGGYPQAGAYLLMVLAATALLWKRRSSALAPAAAAVLLATAVHGMLDVLWVRGTPVLGWLLLGLLLGSLRSREENCDAGSDLDHATATIAR